MGSQSNPSTNREGPLGLQWPRRLLAGLHRSWA